MRENFAHLILSRSEWDPSDIEITVVLGINDIAISIVNDLLSPSRIGSATSRLAHIRLSLVLMVRVFIFLINQRKIIVFNGLVLFLRKRLLHVFVLSSSDGLLLFASYQCT